MTAGGSGSVTSPMPQRISRLGRVGIRVAKLAHPPRDLGKEIAGLKLEIIVV